ncbi:MAG: S-layer homology domain-containing protein [Candidatus Flemingibacterium sp.]|nr:S-layer homology domain-containing protein [Candidatus Flemingibacterium sp.]
MFKRILAGIIACMMIVCALPLGVSAAEDGTTTLRFTAAGGEGSMDDIVVTRKTAGSTKFPENGFTREGYEFKGWGTSTTYPAWQPGTYVSRMSSSYLKYSGNIVTIMPVWAGEKISVTFDDCNGNSETRSLVVGKTYDYVYDASKSDNARRDYSFGYPTRDGYKFLGWFNEAGEEIAYSYKFTADDDGTTIYAHWSRTKTITLDFNGGTTGYWDKKTSDTYELTENGSITVIPDYTGMIVTSWNTEKDGSGKNYGDANLSFDEITTLYAQYRDVERTLKFFKEHGTIDSINVVLSSNGEESIMYTLPGDTYTKDGYDLVSWECSEANSYGRAKTVKVGDTYEIRFTASKEKDSYIFYANWEINTLGRALEAISNALPKNNEVKSTGTLGLPTEGDGYSITYKSSDTNYIDNDGNVILLPADGTKNVTITAAIKTGDGTFDREFILTLFSAESTNIQEKLEEALTNILGNWNMVHVNYSENANFCDFMSAKFAENGIYGVKVTITNEPKKFGDRAGIAKDGTIRFYFYDGLTDYEDNNTRVPYVDIKVEKSGVVIEKEITVELDWDYAKVDAAIDKAFENVTIASRVTEGETISDLPENGIDASSVSGITWISDNPAITIGAESGGKFPVTVNHSEKSVYVTITGTIVWTNPHDDQSQPTRTVKKTYNVRVVGTDPTLSETADYSAVDAAIAKAPTDAEKYTAESFAALTSAIKAVERGLTKDDQARVDAFAKAILDAIDNLVVIPAEDEEDDNFFFIILAELIRRKTLTVVSDGEIVSADTYENRTVIDLSEIEAPEKDGYLFTGWYADAELTEKLDTVTLDRDTTIYAGFESISGELDPEAAADRGAVVTILWKIAGKPVVNYILPFADVDEESGIAEAVRWAASEQIVNGFEDGRFRADQKITREQLAVMLFRVARAENVDTAADFTDIAEVSDWAVDAVNWAVSEGIINGFEDRTLRPAGEVTVAEVIAAAVRF